MKFIAGFGFADKRQDVVVSVTGIDPLKTALHQNHFHTGPVPSGRVYSSPGQLFANP